MAGKSLHIGSKHNQETKNEIYFRLQQIEMREH